MPTSLDGSEDWWPSRLGWDARRIYGCGVSSTSCTTVGTRVHPPCALQAAGTIREAWRSPEMVSDSREQLTAGAGITNLGEPGDDGVSPGRA